MTGSAMAEELRVVPGEYIVTVPRTSANVAALSGLSPHFSSSLASVQGVINHEALVVTVPGEYRAVGAAAAAGSERSVAYDPSKDRCKEIMSEGKVASCSPNFVVRALGVPNDSRFSELWGLGAAKGIDSPRAWDLFTGSSSIVVAVIDTGVDYTHPDLAANIWRNTGETAGNGVDDDGNGFVDDMHGINARAGAAQPGNPMDDHYHGTHVAGTIGAVGNNSLGVVGVNHRVKIMALKFLAANGSGSLADAIRAIDYMTMMRAQFGVNIRVSNNSWGGGGYSEALEGAIRRARNAGIIFVAAAGNSSQDTDEAPSYPAGYELDNVVSVAAIDREQNLASFSNFGATTVDIAAPGVDILSTMPGNQYGELAGTSMATPHVSGALALLLGHEPSLTYPQAIERLYLSGANRSSLADPATGVPLVATRRTLNVARMLHNEVAPLPTPPSELLPCGYDFQTANLLEGGEVDTAADNAPIVIQSDEGNFYQVDLPFSFPFFRDTVSRIWLSPNGLIYTKAPISLDYVVGTKAPKSSIAALQADLIPRAIDQGVRVAVASDRVTVMWSGEHYSAPGQGVIKARLTIRSDGTFSSSAFFGANGQDAALKSRLLGDPFSSPPAAPQALVGSTGALSTFSSSVALDAAQQSLTAGSSEALALGVTMTNACSPVTPPQDGDPEPVVSRISIAKAAGGRLSVPVAIRFQGEGSGSIPVTFRVNGQRCRTGVTVDLQAGSATMRGRVPAGVELLSANASAARGSRRFRWTSVRGSRPSNGALCSKLLGSISQR